LPYGDQAYHLSNTLGMIANPMTCAAAFFLPTLPVPVITVTTVLGVAASTIVLVFASLSPSPPMYDQASGAALIVSKYFSFLQKS